MNANTAYVIAFVTCLLSMAGLAMAGHPGWAFLCLVLAVSLKAQVDD